MADGNPIVVEAERRTTASGSSLEGAGLAQDAHDLVARVASGDWTEGLVSLLSAGLEAKSFVEDPLAKLTSMGLGWVIEHVGVLRDPLNWLTSDQDQLSRLANTWTGIGAEVRQAGQDLDGYYKADAARWAGPAVTQYRTFCADRVQLYTAAADTAASVATTVTVCKGILAVVRTIVRDLVTDCVGKIISIIARYPPPTTAAALPEVTNAAVSAGGAIMTWVRRLETAFANAGRLIEESGNLFKNVSAYVAEAKSAFGVARSGGVGLAGSLGHAARQTGASVAFGAKDAAKQATRGTAEAVASGVKDVPAKAAFEDAKEVAKDSVEQDTGGLYDGPGPYRVTGTL